MTNTYNLFPIRVFHGKLIIPININKKIIKFVDENYEQKNNISCVNGFQYHDNFYGKKELNKFLNKYLKNVYNMKIINSWLHVLYNKSYNEPHNHIGEGVTHAGVLYLSNVNNNINFIKENKVFEIEPKLFDYLIFPSNLFHYVLPKERYQKRICYSFNLK